MVYLTFLIFSFNFSTTLTSLFISISKPNPLNSWKRTLNASGIDGVFIFSPFIILA
jgi:hypothetical protein